MKTPKYLYIDDENDQSVLAICSGFNDQKIIEVEYLEIDEGQTFDSLKTKIQHEQFDGLILDLKLDGEGRNRLNFKAPTLAQDIRTYVSSETTKNAFPIVLCSTDSKMKATYDKDKQSHGLFDYKFLKGSDIDWKRFSIKLFSLSKGYEILNGTKDIKKILAREDIDKLDRRIFENFIDPDNQINLTPYDFSNFILEDLFHHPGILIKEYFIASRLGVDIEKSGKAWEEVKTQFVDSKYKGVFSDGWDRWWSDLVNKKFREISNGGNLNILNAEQRVDVLSSKFSINGLVPATPLKYCTSSNFWTICEETKKPLDPLEGFKVFENKSLKPWQESKYLSFYAIADKGLTKFGLKPKSDELERIEFMAKIIEGDEN